MSHWCSSALVDFRLTRIYKNPLTIDSWISPIGVDLGELCIFVPISTQIKRRIGIISELDVDIGNAQEFPNPTQF